MQLERVRITRGDGERVRQNYRGLEKQKRQTLRREEGKKTSKRSGSRKKIQKLKKCGSMEIYTLLFSYACL